MPPLQLPAFDPKDVPESNATSYPAPFRDANMLRWYRRLGPVAGLTHFGVNLVRIVPGGQSAARHAHAKEEEFVWVLEGEVVLETNAGTQRLSAGHCAGFPAGTGDAHRFVNRSDRDTVLLVVGDSIADDTVAYPDIDLDGRLDAEGHFQFTHKDGTPY